MRNLKLTSIFFEHVKKYGEKAMLHYRDYASEKWVPLSWNEVKKQVCNAANALDNLKIGFDSKVAIFSQNMPEVIISELALFMNRAASVPMFATSTADQIEFIINDASVEYIFVGEQQQYNTAYTVQKRGNNLKKIIVFDQNVAIDPDDNTSEFFHYFVTTAGESGELNSNVLAKYDSYQKEDLASLIYTSGTTGDPKGVMLSHSNIEKAVEIHDIRLTQLTDQDITMCFLPLSHIFEKMWTYYCLTKGLESYINLRPVDIQKTIKEVRPTVMCSVPRFWEKVYEGVQQKIASSEGVMKKLFLAAIETGYSYNVEYLRNGLKPPMGLCVKYKFYEKTIFSTLKKVIGIDRGNFFPCAGSPLSDNINQFLHSCGINLTYGYGLTESTATVCCFESDQYTFGTVGKIMPDVEVKITDEGEILLKGETIFKGYYNRPEVNAEAFVDGWFRTGDAGRLTDKNELIITDRIKDLFKTSNGKYVAPQALETRIIESPYIDYVATIGDNRKFITALVVPNEGSIKKFAAQAKIPYADYTQLLSRGEVKAFIHQQINNALVSFAQFEQIKRITLVDKPFSIETGELTSTLKLRRKIIAEKYHQQIEDMYV